MMNITLVEPELDLRLDVGEGPTWDPSTRTLIFVDIVAGRVLRYTPDVRVLSSFDFGQEVGAAIPTAEGGLVVAARDGVYLTDAHGAHAELLVPVEAANSGNRMNDAKVDPTGRLWAGTMAFDFAEGAGALYAIEGREATRVLPDLTIPNGTDWSPDGTRMYFTDSATYRVDVIDFDSRNGKLGSRRPFIVGDPQHGMPDGLTVDSDGFIWVAFFGAGQVRRYDPDGGLVATITAPVSQVTSCCFGGDDLGTLYITSAMHELGPDQLRAEPFSGAIFACRPGVTGSPSNVFGSATS